VVLGRLDADQMLGGDLGATASLAEQAIRTKIAEPLGMSVTEAALGILRVVNNNMSLAIRSASVARGLDPREFALMPFGGAGPVHGPSLATEVGAKYVLVPPMPGITAAAGLLATDLKYEYTRSQLCNLRTAGADELAGVNRTLAALEAECRDRLAADHVAPEDMALRYIAECRYHGQGFELRVELPASTIDASHLEFLTEAFHEVHEKDYGYGFRGADVELVTLRLIGTGRFPRLDWTQWGKDRKVDGSLEQAYLYTRDTVFDDGTRLPTPRYDRRRLAPEQVIDGPAIILQHDSTSLVPPGWQAWVSPSGNMIVGARTATEKKLAGKQLEETLQ
jgi:N-methylhydantoinase A